MTKEEKKTEIRNIFERMKTEAKKHPPEERLPIEEQHLLRTWRQLSDHSKLETQRFIAERALQEYGG